MSLDAIGIACQNLEKTIQFYSMLGLEFKEFGKEHFEATTTSGLRIMLDSYQLLKEINPDWQEPKSPGVVLCFLQDSPDKVNSVYSEITKHGFKGMKEPWDAFWGQRYASVVDPDGNQIDIFSPLDQY